MLALIVFSPIIMADAKSYVGIDYNWRLMEGRDRDGYSMNQTLGDHYQGVEIYAAHRFSNDVGLSIGLLETEKDTQGHIFNAGELFLGPPQSAGDRSSITTRIQELHLDVNGYYDASDNFELLGQLGFGIMRPNMQATLVASGVSMNLNPSNKYEWIPRMAFGMQYFLPYNIGIRGLLSWEGTNLYSLKINNEDGVQMNIRPFKQSWSFAIGLVGRF